MAEATKLIRKLIARTGLSIQDLSVKIGASDKTIYKWFNGKCLPNCKHLLALLEIIESTERW